MFCPDFFQWWTACNLWDDINPFFPELLCFPSEWFVTETEWNQDKIRTCYFFSFPLVLTISTLPVAMRPILFIYCFALFFFFLSFFGERFLVAASNQYLCCSCEKLTLLHYSAWTLISSSPVLHFIKRRNSFSSPVLPQGKMDYTCLEENDGSVHDEIIKGWRKGLIFNWFKE